MVEFRQKMFIGPLALAAVPALIQGSAGLVQGKMSDKSQEKIAEQQNKQAEKDRKTQQRIANQQARVQEQQLKMAQKQENKIMNLAQKNPTAAASIKPTITANNLPPQQSNFSVTFGQVIGKAGEVGIGALNSGAVTSAMNLKSNKDQIKSNEKIASMENANRALETKAKMQKNNNSTALKMQELKNQQNEFNKSYKLARKGFSAVKEGTGFIKNIGTLAKERGLHKAIAGSIVGGAVAGGASYLVDKAIQRDIKKDGKFKVALSDSDKKELKKRRNKKLLAAVGTGAALVGAGVAAKNGAFGESAKKYITKNNAKKVGNTFKEATKDYFTHVDPETGKRKANVLSLALTGAGVAAPAVMYKLKKKQYEDQVKQSEGEERNYSNNPTSNISFQNISKKIGTSIKRFRKNGPTAKNVDNTLQTTSRKINFEQQLKKVAPHVKEKWSDFKKHPGESTLGKISSWTGGGGRSGVAKFGEDLTNLGVKTGNTTSQKVGNFITNNPKTALAGSIVVGGVVIKKARDKAGNLATKAIETVDPNAYAYSKYGARPVPVRKKDSQEEEENDD